MFEHAPTIKKMWEDPAFQETYSRSSSFQLVTSAKYLLSRVEQVMDPSHVVTKQDVLETRVKTTAIQYYSREMDWEGQMYTVQFVSRSSQFL